MGDKYPTAKEWDAMADAQRRWSVRGDEFKELLVSVRQAVLFKHERAVYDAAMNLYQEYKANNLYISVGNYGFPRKFIEACERAEEVERG